MDNQQLSSEAKLGWLAGIIDGEGCIQLAKQKYRDKIHYRPQLVIGNTSKEIIEAIVSIAQEHNLPVYLMNRMYAAKNSTSTTAVVQIMGLRRVQKWLSLIKPYLFGKRRQASIVLRYIDHRLSQPYPFPNADTFGEIDIAFRSELDTENHRYRTRTAQRLNARQESQSLEGIV